MVGEALGVEALELRNRMPGEDGLDVGLDALAPARAERFPGEQGIAELLGQRAQQREPDLVALDEHAVEIEEHRPRRHRRDAPTAGSAGQPGETGYSCRPREQGVGVRRTGIAVGLAWALAAVIGAAPARHAAAKEMLPIEIGGNWTGDYEGMLKRRRIRVLVVSNKALYFVDAGTQRGIIFDLFSEWEKEINKGRKLPIEVVFVPVRRNELLSALVDGPRRRRRRRRHGDERPAGARRLHRTVANGVHEIVVTGPSSPKLETVDDLAGKEVFVRPSSSYWDTLTALNQRFAAKGKPAVILRAAPEELETGDYLEMLNAGLVDLVVSDRWKAKLLGADLRQDPAARGPRARGRGQPGVRDPQEQPAAPRRARPVRDEARRSGRSSATSS